MDEDHSIQSRIKKYSLILFLLPFEAGFCLYQLFKIPSGNKNIFLWGLTKERLLMAGVLGLFFLIGIAAVLFREKIIAKVIVIDRLLIVFSLIFLFFTLFPSYRFGKFHAYAERLHPFVLCLFLYAFTVTVCCSFVKRGESFINAFCQFTLPFRKPLIVFILIALVFIGILCGTHWGFAPESALWNKNGIPLQSIQLYSCLILFFVLNGIIRKHNINLSRTVRNFFLIWVISALVLAIPPMKSHFFAPGPYDPNLEYYPYSDAIGYDWPAYSAMNGWGFNFYALILKPSVTFISFICHILGGDDYNRGLMIQSALYAILPAIIYLFGKSLRSDGCGFLAAALSLLKEWNALNAQEVLTIHSRLIMSEYLMQIVFAVFCFAVYRWTLLRKDHIKWAALAGGILAIGIYTRYNFFIFLLVGLLPVWVAGMKHRKRACFTGTTVFLLVFLITAFPMLHRSYEISGEIYPEFFDTFREKLIGGRYRIENKDKEISIDPIAKKESYPNDPVIQNTPEKKVIIPTETPVKETIAKKEVYPLIPSTEKPAAEKAALPVENAIEASLSESVKPAEIVSFPTLRVHIHPIIDSILNHGFHNLTASFLTLPVQLTFDDLSHLFTNESSAALWSDSWNYRFTTSQFAGVLLWILVLAFVTAYLWHRDGIAGSTLLYFWLAYSFSIGVSRSSGGRYVVPCNWIPMLLISVFADLHVPHPEIPSEKPETADKVPWKQTVLITCCFASFFLSMRVFEKTIPRKIYKEGMDSFSVFREYFTDPGIDWEKVTEDYLNKKISLSKGKLLYPRFYYYNKGETQQEGAFEIKDYSRLVFQGINLNPKDHAEYVEHFLPHTELISGIPNNSEYYALGCPINGSNQLLDVLGLVVLPEEGEPIAVLRDPMSSFSCPIAEPVCDGIENCH